jgi:hypothetical protein
MPSSLSFCSCLPSGRSLANNRCRLQVVGLASQPVASSLRCTRSRSSGNGSSSVIRIIAAPRSAVAMPTCRGPLGRRPLRLPHRRITDAAPTRAAGCNRSGHLTTTVPCSNGTIRLEKLLTASNNCPLQSYTESCCSAAVPAVTMSWSVVGVAGQLISAGAVRPIVIRTAGHRA